MSANKKPWIDPTSLPRYGDAAVITGNASNDVKQLTSNTLGAYGVGGPDNFAYSVGRKIALVSVDLDKRESRLEATTVGEVVVTRDMLNGGGIMHGGCMCYLIDNCASFPLTALGIATGTNGVGVSQALTVYWHAPAPEGMVLRLRSTTVTLGGRIMSSRCEVVDKATGRMVASGMLSKMQPVSSKL